MMICAQILNTFCVFVVQWQLVHCQWKNGHQNPSYSAPTTYSLPVQYVPAQSPINRVSVPGQYGPITPANLNPYAPSEKSFVYPGEAEVNALQSTYPGQPVIIINNGAGQGGEKKGFNFDFLGDLLPLLLVEGKGGDLLGGGGGKHGHHHSHQSQQKQETAKDEPEFPRMFPGYYGYPGYPGFYPGMPGFPDKEVPFPCKKEDKKTVINITIVLPNSGSNNNMQIESKNASQDQKTEKSNEKAE